MLNSSAPHCHYFSIPEEDLSFICFVTKDALKSFSQQNGSLPRTPPDPWSRSPAMAMRVGVPEPLCVPRTLSQSDEVRGLRKKKLSA